MCDANSNRPAGRRRQRASRANAGFTLIEIMAVVLIMGLLVSVVGVGVFAQVDKAKIKTTKTKISALESAMELYRMDNSGYPPTLDGLVRAPENAKNYPQGGYIRKKSALKDAWENEFQYVAPGAKNVYFVDISSNGPDGAPGTEDDVTNWSDEEGGE